MASFLAAVRGAAAGPAFPNKNIVAVGDSITRGFNVTTGWPPRVGTFYSSTATVKAHDGVGWIYDGVNDLTHLAAEVDAVLASPAQTLILFAGTNDINHASTASDTFTAMMNYRAARVAAGFVASQIIVCTMLPRGGISETVRSDYNTQIVNGAATYGYTVAPLHLDSRIGLAGCQNDPTYYQLDLAHPNDTGMGVIASIIEGVMG